MNKDTYFQGNPTKLGISRAKFDMSHRWTSTFATGYLIPNFCEEVMPSDTFTIDVAEVIRGSTPITAVMDDCFLDQYFFYVPNRLLLSRRYASPDVSAGQGSQSWEAIMGAQDSLLNFPTSGAPNLPYLDMAGAGVSVSSLADYFGLPIGLSGDYDFSAVKLNPLPFMGYFAIWNEFFRDPNTMSPVTWSFGNSSFGVSVDFYRGGDRLVPGLGYSADYGAVMPVCRFHGYFGSALPWTQNGSSVGIPLTSTGTSAALTFINPGSVSSSTNLQLADYNTGHAKLYSSTGLNAQIILDNTRVTALSDSVEMLVNAVRSSFSAQRWCEAIARGGNRYGDLLAATFGGRNNLPLDRPEYLGGKRIRLDQTQVAATNASSAGSGYSGARPNTLGVIGAYSLNGDSSSSMVVKSFTEWGYIIGVCCVRVADSFCQGIRRHWLRRSRLDYYWPQFAHVGEQAVLQCELYFDGKNAPSKGLSESLPAVFGYQEAWAEYRYSPDVVCGLVRPGQNLSYFTYCNNFSAAPDLGDFLDASSEVSNVDRTLSVANYVSGFQWLAQFKFDIHAVRPMPLYSVPGLVDHD